jgi:CHAT domain/SIR2-like domain
MTNRTYKDFNLSIRAIDDGKSYRAEVTESAGGDGSADFTSAELPFDSLLAAPADAPAIVRHLSGAGAGASNPYLFGTQPPPNKETAESYGARLFDAVFKNTLRYCLLKSRDSAIKSKAILRLRLFLTEVPELGVLPWEYLFIREYDMFFGYDKRPTTAIVRYLNLPEEIEDLTVKSPLRVLVMISKPSDAAQLMVDQEWQQLVTALAPLREQNLVELELLSRATLAALDERLAAQPEDLPFHVFHFIGHGLFDPSTGEGKLLLEDEQRRGEPVSGENLGGVLRGYGLRLAVINACEGARIAPTDSYLGLAPGLLRAALIPAVVAMQFEITDQAAISFARHFYGAIAGGRPVDEALSQARQKMCFLDKRQVEWAFPVLYMRTRNGYLLEPQAVDEKRPANGGKAAPQLQTVMQPLEEHYQSVIEALRDGQLVPFLGLDINMFGREPADPWQPGATLPGNQELARYLAAQFNYPTDKLGRTPDLLKVSQYAAVKGKLGKLYEEMTDIFGGARESTPLHRFLARLPQLLRERGYPLKKDPLRQRLVIVTTNYDNQLETAFNQSAPVYHVVSYLAKGGDQGRFLHCKFRNGVRQFAEVITDGNDYRAFAEDRDYDPVILNLPGSLNHGDASRRFSIAITEDQYFDYLTNRELSILLPAELTSKLRWSSHLFLGYSLWEWNLRALVFRIWDEQKPSYPSWAIHRGGDGTDEQFWRSCGVEPVAAALPDYLAGLSERLERMPSAGGEK